MPYSWARPQELITRDVSGSSAGGISDPHEGRGAGGASTSRAILHDVLICNSPRDPDVSRALSHASNNALLVGLAVQNAALLHKLKLKQPKRYVLFLLNFPLFVDSGERVGGARGS